MLTRTPENGPCNRFPRKKNVEDKVISRFETNLRGLAMKFAHELDDARAVSDPLWRDAFIDYKRLKKIVSRRRRGSSAASAGAALALAAPATTNSWCRRAAARGLMWHA